MKIPLPTLVLDILFGSHLIRSALLIEGYRRATRVWLVWFKKLADQIFIVLGLSGMLLGVCCPAAWPNTIIDPVSNLLVRVENSALIGIHGCSDCGYIEENPEERDAVSDWGDYRLFLFFQVDFHPSLHADRVIYKKLPNSKSWLVCRDDPIRIALWST